MSARTRRRSRAVVLGTGLSMAVVLAACGGGGESASGSGEGDGVIEVWAHSGQAAEAEALEALVAEYNDSQEDVSVELTLIPEPDYTSTVQATAAEDLPDVMEMDAPTMASFVYDRKLVPLDDVVSQETLENRIEGVRESGTYQDQTYAVGMFDVGLGLWGNQQLLDAAGVEAPATADEAWTAEEFEQNLQKLAEVSPSGNAIDLGEANGFAAEWGTFTTSPVLWSNGGTLIRDGAADGVLNSAENVEALEEWA